MSEEQLTKKEKYLVESFKFEIPVVKQITEIGRLLGTHKYDVWIAKEVKKNDILLSKVDDFLYIHDWANKVKPNIFELSFDEAFQLSTTWHGNLKFDDTAKNKSAENDDRILYRCKDGKYYFVLLGPDELEMEGNVMGSCVGSYKNKVESGKSLIISLRDNKNDSHTTIERYIQSGIAIQAKGRSNNEPAPKYLSKITEFALFSSGHHSILDEELLELMNMKFE